jgi:hypothetical protein
VLGQFAADPSGATPEIGYRWAFGAMAALSVVAALIYAPIRDAKPRT